MLTDKLPDASPIQFSVCAIDNMHHVGAIETLPEINKQLRGDELLGGQHSRRYSQHLGRRASVDPGLIDSNDGVAHTGDEVHEVSVAVRLGEPDRVRNFGLESFLLQVQK